MRVVLVQKHLRLWPRRLLGPHYHAGFLLDVLVEQFAVGRDGQLSVHAFVFIIFATTAAVFVPICKNKIEKRENVR
jgi:hypothetical protein